jgi:glycosyltransferase involved in cell wall biosynthesis
MKRLLLVSPHFPPDAAAGAHRARVLAPYLDSAGWRPTILTVEKSAYAGTLDEELGELVPRELEVVRAPAWKPSSARRLGVGDLGLRALPGLWRTARQLLSAHRFDAVFITTYPVYPALLGPKLRAHTAAPLVIDLQDPWTGAWGMTVGGAPDGSPDLRSRVSRRLLGLIEERVLPACDAITGVSTELLSELRERYPALQRRPSLAFPVGLDPRDLEWVRAHPRSINHFDASDGNFHVCHIGTVVPLAIPTLRAVFDAVRHVRATHPDLAARLRFHFIGTSNQSDGDAAFRVKPLAAVLGIGDLVHEHPSRIPFADALRVQLAASALLVLGSTESRYTASKLAPALAAGRPLLVVAHEASGIVDHVRHTSEPGLRVISFGDGLDGVTRSVHCTLTQWLTTCPPAPHTASLVAGSSGPSLAMQLGSLLDSLITKC